MTTRRATTYTGPSTIGFDHEYRYNRNGRCDLCGRNMREAAHGYTVTVTAPQLVELDDETTYAIGAEISATTRNAGHAAPSRRARYTGMVEATGAGTTANGSPFVWVRVRLAPSYRTVRSFDTLRDEIELVPAELAELRRNGGHLDGCEGACVAGCPIGEARRADADERAAAAQRLWTSRELTLGSQLGMEDRPELDELDELGLASAAASSARWDDGTLAIEARVGAELAIHYPLGSVKDAATARRADRLALRYLQASGGHVEDLF